MESPKGVETCRKLRVVLGGLPVFFSLIDLYGLLMLTEDTTLLVNGATKILVKTLTSFPNKRSLTTIIP